MFFVFFPPQRLSVSAFRFVRCLWLMSLAVVIVSSQTDKEGRHKQKVLLHTNVARNMSAASVLLPQGFVCGSRKYVSTLSNASARLSWKKHKQELDLGCTLQL